MQIEVISYLRTYKWTSPIFLSVIGLSAIAASVMNPGLGLMIGSAIPSLQFLTTAPVAALAATLTALSAPILLAAAITIEFTFKVISAFVSKVRSLFSKTPPVKQVTDSTPTVTVTTQSHIEMNNSLNKSTNVSQMRASKTTNDKTAAKIDKSEPLPPSSWLENVKGLFWKAAPVPQQSANHKEDLKTNYDSLGKHATII